jgi:cytidylate kinase
MKVIAIDGPAASGKSSVARGLSEHLGYFYINTGAMYRAATWHVLRSGVDPQLSESVASLIASAPIHTGFQGQQSFVEIAGVRPYEELREESVNRAVSAVSSVPAVRERLVREFRDLAAKGNCVVEGRDIGSVVFPDTPYKFYLDANPEVRQSRRNAQGQRDEVVTRDRIDSSRHTAPLTIAGNATVIDTSDLDLEEVIGAVLHALSAKGLSACESA